MTYYLNREAMRLVLTNDKGQVKKRKRYTFGDEVDPGMFGEEGQDRIDVLVEKGTLVESKDDLDRRAGFRLAASGASASQRRAQATTVDAGVGAAGAGTPALDAPEPTGDEDEGPLVPEPTHEDEPQGGGAATATSDDNDSELVDTYSSMDYSELQQAAKKAGLNAGGSAEDLRTRLRENDES